MCRVCECRLDNEVPKQLDLSSNGKTNESGTGGQHLLFGFSCSLVSRRTRVLDSCSLIIRAIHIREAYGTPLSQSLIPSYFLGPQTSLRFYLLSCTYAMLLFYLRLCEEHTVLFRAAECFRGIDNPSFGFPVVYSH